MPSMARWRLRAGSAARQHATCPPASIPCRARRGGRTCAALRSSWRELICSRIWSAWRPPPPLVTVTSRRRMPRVSSTSSTFSRSSSSFSRSCSWSAVTSLRDFLLFSFSASRSSLASCSSAPMSPLDTSAAASSLCTASSRSSARAAWASMASCVKRASLSRSLRFVPSSTRAVARREVILWRSFTCASSPRCALASSRSSNSRSASTSARSRVLAAKSGMATRRPLPAVRPPLVSSRGAAPHGGIFLCLQYSTRRKHCTSTVSTGQSQPARK
mmetsp:Transcript_9970/g.29425  ORF Transcript_9970/g.29425 Transcript_9970/m.29425 type:complete len:274 (+) Transcript_9970:1944-2765(+)